MDDAAMNLVGAVGIVVIGRNEGARLAHCFASLPPQVIKVYVDSASTDDSVAIAAMCGVPTIGLSAEQRLSAARARNAGIAWLRHRGAPPRYVQTIDGDCTLDRNWLSHATERLEAQSDIAVVAGRLRERQPGRSIYNRLCDDEWDAPEGLADECGGVALWRTAMVVSVGMFDESLAMGEEPELCHRLRRAGWQIWRTRAPMGTHDAAITQFTAWARRTYRSGYAVAQLADRYGIAGEPRWRRELARIAIWAAGVPIAAGAVGLLAGPWPAGAVLSMWLVLIGRMTWRGWRTGRTLRWAVIASSFNLLGKFAQAAGVVRYHHEQLLRSRARSYRYEK